MSTTPTYADELRFLRWTDSSRNGPCVTFALPSREALQAFIGNEGKRLASVLVLIGDDELPVPPPAPAPKQAEPVAPKVDHELSKWAALRCTDRQFWQWAERLNNFRDGPINSSEECADWIRRRCGVKSRAEFDTDREAAERFKARVMRPWQKRCIAAGIT